MDQRAVGAFGQDARKPAQTIFSSIYMAKIKLLQRFAVKVPLEIKNNCPVSQELI
jgi:hypothetical protein